MVLTRSRLEPGRCTGARRRSSSRGTPRRPARSRRRRPCAGCGTHRAASRRFSHATRSMSQVVVRLREPHPVGLDRRGVDRRASPADEVRGARHQASDAVAAGVDVEAVAAQEPHQRHAEALRRLDGEARRRRDRRHDGDSRDGRLLDDLERRPGRRPSGRGRASGSSPASAARARPPCPRALWRPTSSRTAIRSPSASKSAGGVQAPGGVEHALRGAQPLGQGEDGLARDARAGAERRAAHLHLVEAGLAADPARRGRRHTAALAERDRAVACARSRRCRAGRPPRRRSRPPAAPARAR